MAEKTIGKAYVQILPSTKGIESKLSTALKPAAAKAGGDGGESAGVNFAKKLIGAVAAAGVAAKIGGFIKDSVGAAGTMQQAIGGIETLFGDQAEKMVANANNAWKTAGISANEYMQNVTSFSASLLQSLEGDTAKAATVSDRIMRDMADNANKFGTDMGSIQHAYQGFSKQNYTMLDNLKLGYGGTKTEAERLVNEMSKLTDVQAELGVTVKEGDLSFANLANAISVAQKNMGVMGTTAKEADGTLEGSFNSMGAAWENLKAHIALGDADIKPALESLVKSVVTSLENMIPMVVNVVSALPEIAETLIKEFGQKAIISLRANQYQWISGIKAFAGEIMDYIESGGLEEIVGLIMTIVSEAANLIGQAMPILMPALVNLLTYVAQVIIENWPTLMQAGLSILEGLVNGILASLPVLIEQLPVITQALVDYFVNNLPQIVATGVSLITALAQGLIQAVPQMISAVVNTLKANWPKLKAAGRDILKSIKDGALSVLSSLAAVGRDIVSGIWQGIQGRLDWIKNLLKGWIGNVKDFLKNLFGIASPSKWARDEIGKWIPAGIAVGIEAKTDLVDKALKDLKADLTTRMSFVPAQSYQPYVPEARTKDVQITVYGAQHQDELAIARYVDQYLTGEVRKRELAYA